MVWLATAALFQKNLTEASSCGVRSGVSVELSWFTMRCVELQPISVRSRPSGDASTVTLAAASPPPIVAAPTSTVKFTSTCVPLIGRHATDFPIGFSARKCASGAGSRSEASSGTGPIFSVPSGKRDRSRGSTCEPNASICGQTGALSLEPRPSSASRRRHGPSLPSAPCRDHGIFQPKNTRRPIGSFAAFPPVLPCSQIHGS